MFVELLLFRLIDTFVEMGNGSGVIIESGKCIIIVGSGRGRVIVRGISIVVGGEVII
jgi:hypothetical protein